MGDIPREEVPWYPTIDYDKCTGCLTCVDFCRNAVYSTEGNPAKPKVSNPCRCVVGCSSCSIMCPAGAISFPPKEEVFRLIRSLREEQAR